MTEPFDIPQAVALSTEAGWNQTPEDWRRLLALAPTGCYGIHVEGRLVSTLTAVTYPSHLAWIGMVLTTESQRGKGYARALLHRALDDLDQAGIASVKLDATDQGRPVYAKLGFRDERPVSRWRRAAGPFDGASSTVLGEADFSLDREAFQADRSGLLRSLSAQEVYNAGVNGFALARPGRLAWQFGPCVAKNEDAARNLFAAFLLRHGDEPSIIDLCDDHPVAPRIAQEAGYVPVRRLMRMYRGSEAYTSLASGPLIYTLAGFEYG